MNFYKLEFDGKNTRTQADEHFLVFINAESEQDAISKVIQTYQATNIEVLDE